MKQAFKATHVKNKSHTLRLMAVFAICAAPSYSLCAEPAYSREAILQLLPDMIPPYSKEVWNKLHKLEQLGEAAYPVLCEEMLASTKLDMIQAIINVFISSKGDKKLPLEAIRNLAIKRDSDEDIRDTVVRALGYFGKPEDVVYLHKRLADPELIVQISAVESLGQIGGIDSVPLIEAWGVKNSSDKYRTEEAKKAIESIRQRAKAQPSGK